LVEGSLGICQQGYIYMGSFFADFETEHTIVSGNGAYIFLLKGEIEVNGEKILTRDALGVWNADKIRIKALQNSEILLIDVPMN
jgi:redox-sensitive bicupin YhaK (pirin superfamily)